MNHVDFLPETIRIKRERNNRVRREAYLVVVLIGALALLGTVRQRWISKAQAQLVTIETRSTNIQLQLDYRSQLENMEANLMIRQRIKDDLGSRANALDVMVELENIMPPTIVLKEMQLETVEDRIPITEANQESAPQIAGNNRPKKFRIEKRLRLIVTGLSPTDVDVANFIAQMSANPCFEDVNMGYARNVEYRQRRAREFQASCYLAR